MPYRHTAIVFFLLLTATVKAADAPDLILHNAAVYTVNPMQKWAEAVAVTKGLISAVGDNATVLKLADTDTQLMDLEGRMLMPGINDAHIHPVMGGMKELYECNFPFTAKPAEIQQTIAACVADPNMGEWIVGGQWDSGFFDNHPLESPRRFLDEVSADKYVFLSDDASHNAWLNSKALEYFSITADSIDPPGGRIVRKAGTQVPNGVLLETAAIRLERRLPVHTRAKAMQAILYVQDRLLSYGVTGIKEARTSDIALQAYQSLERQGKLKLNIATSLQTPYGPRGAPLAVDAYLDKRKEFQSPHVHTAFIKIFMDGVPTPSRTAKMLAPYLPDEKHGADYTGALHLGEDMLATDLKALDEAGFTVKIHTAGDGSVSTALDAIEQVRRANGRSGLMFELAHAGFIAPADIPRFSALNVAADFSPYLWHPSPIIDAVLSAVGERGRHYWPTRDLLADKATIIAGSDWPAAVPSANPWVGIEAMVTRTDPYAQVPGRLWPEQAIDLAQVLAIFTLNGAHAMRLDDKLGVIEAGKAATMIVLERNLFQIPPDEIADTKVVLTFFEGEIVHPQAGR